MTKAEKDVFDYYMHEDFKKLEKEIRKSTRYIKYHPRIFRYPKDEIDFNWLAERLKLLNAIYGLRSNILNKVEFDSMYKP